MSHALFGGEVITSVVLAILGLGIILAGIRVARGPTLADRVIAFDLIAVLAMGKIATLAIVMHQSVFLDAVIILALLAFLATVAFARYLGASRPWQRRWPR